MKSPQAPKSRTGRSASASPLSSPSIATHLPSGRPSADYDQLGIPFKGSTGTAVMDLETFVGAAAIQTITTSGKIIFHSMGDSGVGTSDQEMVAGAMATDIDESNHELGPSFMIHLGDVLYGTNKLAKYADRFYRQYDHYNRLIFAIPGNHDGEVFPSTDPTTLQAYLTNFCSPSSSQPPLAKSFGVRMPNQPGPYWHLTAPFVDIIGLYSNADENTGIIRNAKVGTTQKTWLQNRLSAIASDRRAGTRNALVLAMHHPPYARGLQDSGLGHPGSPEMLQDIDDCCQAAGILPDAVIAGHTHSYQHYVRTQTLNGVECTIPYLIIGTGGIGLQKLPAPTGVKNPAGDVFYFSAFKDYGYLTVTATSAQLQLVFSAVVATHREVREQVTVDLATHRIV